MATFLEEYNALKKKFPRVDRVEQSTENVTYGDHVVDSKNCYYVFDSMGLSECMYVYDGFKETNAIDTLWNGFCDHCIEVSDSGETSNSVFSQYLGQCYNMWYCFNCYASHDCFGCYNLSNKEFCIFNVQYTEEEYQEKIKELKKLSPDEIINKVKTEVESKFPKIQAYFNDNNNSDYVNYVYKSNAAYYCFDSTSLDDCKYVNNSIECSGLIDASYCNKTENSVEAIDTKECYNCYEVQESNRCYDSYFIYNCNDCSNCFACANLSNKQYCILNVQYTKDEYLAKLAEIKKENGLFFTEAATA